MLLYISEKNLTALPGLYERNPVNTGGFPSQSAGNAELWCLLYSNMKKLLIKQPRGRWFEAPSRSYNVRHGNALFWSPCLAQINDYSDIISAVATQLTGVSIIHSTVCSGAEQRMRQSSASLVFVMGIHRWPVNSPHRGPVTRKMFPLDYAIIGSDNGLSPVRCLAII